MLSEETIFYRKYAKTLFGQGLARRFLLNPCYISRLFMANGENFHEYLMALRMEHALHLLENSRISIKEIACHIGFNTTGYFIRAFSLRYGVTPGAFRSRLRSGSTTNITKVH